jgi:hypothetical protein
LLQPSFYYAILHASPLYFFWPWLVVSMDYPFGEQTNTYKSLPVSRLTDKCPLCPPYSPWHTYTTNLAHYTNYYI